MLGYWRAEKLSFWSTLIHSVSPGAVDVDLPVRYVPTYFEPPLQLVNTVRVTWSEEDNEYVGLCVEFASLSWLASEPETALQGIRQVVADVVADLQKNYE